MIANVSHLRSHNGRTPVAVSAAAPAAERFISLSPFHACRHLGNARGYAGTFSRIAEALMGWLRDDMDAATRRRFA